MITVIQNGVNLIGINSFWQGSVTGLAILVAHTDRPRRQGASVNDQTKWRKSTCAKVKHVLAAAAAALLTVGAAAQAADKYTVVYIAPSLDISYWQWVAYGAKTEAAKLGMNYIEMTSENSPSTQMNNIRTAVTRGVKAVVIGPVSSTSTPPVLRFLKEHDLPVAFAGIGPAPGQTDYTSSVTANNYETGVAEGKFVCDEAKKLGGNKIGMLSLPQDRENAQKYLRGAKEAFKAEGCELVQILQTHGLTVSEAVEQANDLLTAHPDIKGIYGMYDEAATGAGKALETRGLVGKIAVATADGSPTTIKLLRDGVIQGLFLQEAVGQGIDATEQVYNALTGKKVTKDLPLPEPLVTKDTIDSPEMQAKVKRVYPPFGRRVLSEAAGGWPASAARRPFQGAKSIKTGVENATNAVRLGRRRAGRTDQPVGRVDLRHRDVGRYGLRHPPRPTGPAAGHQEPADVRTGALDGDGCIWIAEAILRAVICIDPDGTEIARIEGDGEERFLFPNDLAFGPDGHLYMTDFGKVASDFISGQNFVQNFMALPWDGRVYEIDPKAGKAVRKIDSGIRFANGIAFDTVNRLYANASFTGEVYRYDVFGAGTPRRELFGNVLQADDRPVFKGTGRHEVRGGRTARSDRLQPTQRYHARPGRRGGGSGDAGRRAAD